MPEEHEQADGEAIEDLELDDAEEVTGGLNPRPPAGPVPIPYPNVRP